MSSGPTAIYLVSDEFLVIRGGCWEGGTLFKMTFVKMTVPRPHYQKSPVTQKRVSQVGTAIPRSHNVHKRSLGEIGAKAPVTTYTCKSTVNIMVVHIKNILVMLPKSFRRKKSKMPESDRWTYSRCYFCILCVPVLLWSCLSCDSCF